MTASARSRRALWHAPEPAVSPDMTRKDPSRVTATLIRVARTVGATVMAVVRRVVVDGGPRRRILVGLPVGVVLLVAVGAPAAIAATATITAGPTVWRQLAAQRLRRTRERQLGAFVELLARQLGAGRSLRQAVAAAADELVAPLGDDLATVRDEVALGARPGRAFARFAGTVGSELFALAGAALELHERRGGHVVATLRRLGTIVRDRRTADDELRAITVQGRWSGVIVAFLPLVTALLFPIPSGGGLPWPLWTALQLVGWGLVAAGLVVIWRLTEPDAAAVAEDRRSARHGRDDTRAPSPTLRFVGRHAPRALRGDRRSVELCTRLGLERIDPARLQAVAGQRVLCGVAGACFGVAFFGTGALGAGAAIALGVGGWLWVEWPWRRSIDARRAAVEAEIPQMCDLCALELGAGTSLRAALVDVGELLPGPLGVRLRTMTQRLELGEPFDDALGTVAAEVGSDDLDEVVATLREARRRGGALGTVLDQLAADMRLRARLRRQAAARTVPVKVLFPLTFFVLPAFGILTVVPLVVRTLADLQF